MSLRGRLPLYFSLIVLLPLAVAAVAARAALVGELERRSGAQVGLALAAVDQQVELVADRAGDLADDLGAPARGLGPALVADDRPALQEAVVSALGQRQRADVVLLVAPDGEVLAQVVDEPDVPEGYPVPPLGTLAGGAVAGEVDPALAGQVRPIQDPDGGTLGSVLVARWVDMRLAEQLRGDLDVDVTLLVDGRIAGTTVEGWSDETMRIEGDRADIGGAEAIVRTHEYDGWSTVASLSAAPLAAATRNITTGVLGLLLAAALAAAFLGWLLALVVVRPLRELAGAARDVAAGDLDRRIEATSNDEVGVLGRAFNAMTDELRDRVHELEISRDALQHSLDRLGQTLSSTLDLNRTLTAIVEAAMTALTARRAALYMVAPGRHHLYVKVGRDMPPAEVEATIPIGEGLVGWVAQTGSSVRLPQDADQVPAEAQVGSDSSVIAVPLFTPKGGQVIGVLGLYDRTDDEPFDDGDLHTIRTFAVQASVAIENVRLHEATQQASITDSLTGLWNLRYLHQRTDEEVERAARFGHELALLILDIDHFKLVNDRLGHMAGDQVLIEVAQRVAAQIREVDTLARYGGEELVLVLPETDVEGGRRTAERIRAAIAAQPIVSAGEEVTITASLGVAAFPAHGTSSGELLQEADRAMYAAKAAGRDRVAVAPSRAVDPEAQPDRDPDVQPDVEPVIEPAANGAPDADAVDDEDRDRAVDDDADAERADSDV